jgi:MFS family permease
LRWFWFDGVFARASDTIVSAYQTLFMLALGANPAQIGLISGLSNLSAALLLLPGASLVERWGRRKWLVVSSGGGGARIVLLALALLPLMLGGETAIYTAIALTVVRSAFGSLSLPAWVSLTADMVPLQWRGRYLSFRNLCMEIAGMLATLAIGYLITRVGGLAGYQIAMGIACAIGFGATYSFARLNEPPAPVPAPETKSSPRWPIAQGSGAQRNFVAFCATAALWNLSLNIAGPFFSVYLVEGLKADASVVGALAVVTSLSALPGQRLFGRWVDRRNPYRVQLITGWLIPALPLAWVIIRSPWHVVPINLASGFLWAGYDLAAFNMLLMLSPEERRAHYSAVYQIVVTVALAVGGALGGVIVSYWGYTSIFILSGVGRLCASLLFARLVRPPADPTC